MTDLQTAGSRKISAVFPDEAAHLEKIQTLLTDALKESAASVEQHDREYMESKRYIAEYRHEIDPKEIFQNQLLLEDIERYGNIAVKEREQLKKLMDSPYFARIDFRTGDEPEAEAYYIGRFTFRKDYRIFIYDWRAPLAGMFYDKEPGPAGYDAPAGHISGELTRKRQFKIRQGRIEYALESDLNIGDDVLQKELSSTSDEKMKTIIATIQRDQNQIIRDDKARIMIIQGAAGSGKTSIALHRIAYLLYRRRDSLAADNIVILSPNKVFGDYISGVLPELGEEPVYELGFEDIASAQLDGIIGFHSRREPLRGAGPDWSRRAAFKATLDFIIRLDDYISEAADKIFIPQDYTFERFCATAAWINDRYQAYKKYPIRRRLKEIADDIYDRFETENIREEEIPGKPAIRKALTKMLKVKSTLALYRDFYKQIKKPELFVMSDVKTLEWEDVYPFLYLHASYQGLKENQKIRHVVIDEMQDYTPIQYEVINRLFVCPKTILGDFGQRIDPNNSNSLDHMRQLYPESSIVELTKSYRSSYEIIRFAGKICPSLKLDPIKRHGEEPQLIECQNPDEELARIKKAISAFRKNKNNTLGIITKTSAEAEKLYADLSKCGKIKRITPDSTQFETGVMITSVQMSKGLEFDEVIIPGADAARYQTEFDRSLLYISCTRAMHRLTLIGTSPMTSLIPKE